MHTETDWKKWKRKRKKEKRVIEKLWGASPRGHWMDALFTAVAQKKRSENHWKAMTEHSQTDAVAAEKKEKSRRIIEWPRFSLLSRFRFHDFYWKLANWLTTSQHSFTSCLSSIFLCIPRSPLFVHLPVIIRSSIQWKSYSFLFPSISRVAHHPLSS